MTALLQTTRRDFLAGVSALSAAASGIFGLAGAMTPASAAVQAAGGVGWGRAGARDLERFVGHVFTIKLADGNLAPLNLIEVQAIDSGPHRPADLARAQGAVMVFDFGANEELVEAGHRTYRVSHPGGMGECDVFLGPVRRRTGGHCLEAVLN